MEASGSGDFVAADGRPADLDRWAGCWVAVRRGKIIQAAPTSHELVRLVRSMGIRGDDVVAQYVPERSDVIVIGVG